jgi:hypothetical protein
VGARSGRRDEGSAVMSTLGLLSAPDTDKGRLQRACLELLREHQRDGALPTNGRFLFYELEQRGVVPKHRADKVRQPASYVCEALTHLREKGIVPWSWITDETRELVEWKYADSVFEYAANAVDHARIDLWLGDPPPLIICESRAVKGVLERLAGQYLVPITATAGQCGGFLVNEVVPRLKGNDRRVGYIGDHEIRGPAEQIEANTKRVLERHALRDLDEDTWERIALTQAQVKADRRLRASVIEKVDRRNNPPKVYEAVECEAIKQTVLINLVRKWLDAQLPEPLKCVQEREEQQRDRVRALVETWEDDDA